MCGICGIINHDKKNIVNELQLKDMSDKLTHRGPDAFGYYLDNNLGFGHRRLSIIDISTGSQPMKKYNCVITFNGEIYNYLELKDELIKYGYTFETKSDTEVILAAYDKWGLNSFNKFNGMWAFAIYDYNQEKLILSVDRMGKKPLYYHITNDSVFFASELKSLPKLNFQVNLEILELYLSLGYIPAPYTIYKNVYKLEGGHYIVINSERYFKQKYWDLPDVKENDLITDEKLVYRRFEELLYDSVFIRTRADVPYAAFLSGGLDSTAVVYILSNLIKEKITTFTVKNTIKEFDESHLAKQTSLLFGTDYQEIILDGSDLENSLINLMKFIDEPFGTSSAIPMFAISQKASKSFKVILTGDGGDEVLAGYTTYQGEKFANYYNKLPVTLQKFLLNSAQYFANMKFKGNLKYKINWIYKVLNDSYQTFQKRIIGKACFVPVELVKDLLLISDKTIKIEDYFSDFYKNCSLNDNFYKINYYHLKLSLPGEMLTKIDRMSMANSLELRSPFLDYRLVEFLFQVHKNVKMKKFQRKTILRNTIGKYFPKDVLNNKKMGFSVPIREWFKDSTYRKLLFDNNQKLLSIVDQALLERIYSNNYNGLNDYGVFLWIITILKNFLERENV